MEVEFTNINAENVRGSDEISVKLPSTNTKHKEKPSERVATQDNPLNKQEVKELTDKIQNCLNKMNISLNFSTYGRQDERTSVTVTEKETGKVIREIPPKELQQLYLKMDELTGILFNHTI